jgi:hypothetical protein
MTFLRAIPYQAVVLQRLMQHVRSSFSSIKITEDLRKYAADQASEAGEVIVAGLRQKSGEFIKKHSEIYGGTEREIGNSS